MGHGFGQMVKSTPSVSSYPPESDCHQKTSAKKRSPASIYALLAAITLLLGIAAFLWFTKPQPAKEQKISTFSTKWGGIQLYTNSRSRRSSADRFMESGVVS